MVSGFTGNSIQADPLADSSILPRMNFISGFDRSGNDPTLVRVYCTMEPLSTGCHEGFYFNTISSFRIILTRSNTHGNQLQTI